MNLWLRNCLVACMSTAAVEHQNRLSLAPREHGATAMALTPFVSAAILQRQVHWQELVALLAIIVALVEITVTVRNRQRSVWFQVLSAIALTGTSIAACLSGTGAVPGWWRYGFSAQCRLPPESS